MEILVVIVIFVILLGIAVPVFRSLTGTRSVEQATNVMSAFLGRVRNNAIATHEPRGAIFYFDQALGRNVMQEVRYEDPATSRINSLVDGDVVPLPPGIAMTSVYSGTLRCYPSLGAAGAYMDSPTNQVRNFPSLLMFSADGCLREHDYWIGGDSTLAQYFAGANVWWNPPNPPSHPAPYPLASQLVIELFEREPFENSVAAGRAGWLNANSTQFLLNRYNGTLIRGE